MRAPTGWEGGGVGWRGVGGPGLGPRLSNSDPVAVVCVPQRAPLPHTHTRTGASSTCSSGQTPWCCKTRRPRCSSRQRSSHASRYGSSVITWGCVAFLNAASWHHAGAAAAPCRRMRRSGHAVYGASSHVVCHPHHATWWGFPIPCFLPLHFSGIHTFSQLRSADKTLKPSSPEPCILHPLRPCSAPALQILDNIPKDTKGRVQLFLAFSRCRSGPWGWGVGVRSGWGCDRPQHVPVWQRHLWVQFARLARGGWFADAVYIPAALFSLAPSAACLSAVVCVVV